MDESVDANEMMNVVYDENDDNDDSTKSTVSGSPNYPHVVNAGGQAPFRHAPFRQPPFRQV